MKYFLFGSKACGLYQEGDLSISQIADICSGEYELFFWDDFCQPQDILSAFIGWNDYAEISEQEYEELYLKTSKRK